MTILQQDETSHQVFADSAAKYFIDADKAEERSRSLPVMIASRRCYLCQQSAEEALASAEADDLIVQIKGHCVETQDYLPPDTPLKEAIFRVLLSRHDEPMGAGEISAALGAKWVGATNQRDTSTDIIERLLQHSDSYCIALYHADEEEEED